MTNYVFLYGHTIIEMSFVAMSLDSSVIFRLCICLKSFRTRRGHNLSQKVQNQKGSESVSKGLKLEWVRICLKRFRTRRGHNLSQNVQNQNGPESVSKGFEIEGAQNRSQKVQNWKGSEYVSKGLEPEGVRICLKRFRTRRGQNLSQTVQNQNGSESVSKEFRGETSKLLSASSLTDGRPRRIDGSKVRQLESANRATAAVSLVTTAGYRAAGHQ